MSRMPRVTTVIPVLTLLLSGIVAGALLGSQLRPAPEPGPMLPQAMNAEPSEALRQVSRITVEQALALHAPLYVDVRSPEAYRLSHIRDAIWVPGHEIDQHLAKLPKERDLVFYCT